MKSDPKNMKAIDYKADSTHPGIFKNSQSFLIISQFSFSFCLGGGSFRGVARLFPFLLVKLQHENGFFDAFAQVFGALVSK